MPTVDIEENIKQIQEKIIGLNQEIFRLQGALQMMMDFKKGGLTTIDLPKDPNQKEEEDEEPAQAKIEEINTQENPE